MLNEPSRDVSFSDILSALSPSNQRLVRELILKLGPSISSAPFDYSSAIPFWIFHLVATGKSRSCVRCYPMHARLFLSEFPFPTMADVEFYFSRLLSSGLSISSINNKLVSFRSLGAFCLDNSLTDSNPFAKLKSLKMPHYEVVCPSEVAVCRLLSNSLSPRDLALYSLFVDTGLRLSELLYLRISDISSGRVRVIGKGKKQRSVSLSPFSQLALIAHLFTLSSAAPYAFPGRFPNTPMSPRFVEEHLTQLCLQCGVTPITPHQLRHYFATYMLNHGANLKIVSETLGHSSYAVTADIYWHIDAGAREIEHDKYGPLSHPPEVRR